MTSADDRLRSGRFGAASPGLRPERQSLEDLLTTRQPPPARRRRMLVVIICIVAVLAAGGGGYLSGRLTAPGPPALTRILVTDAALPQGARLSAADLITITVRRGISTPPGSLGPAAEPSLLGLATTTALPSETVLTRSLLAPAASVPLAASALVGLALKPGQLPAGGLAEGEQVLIVLVPSSSNAPASPLVTSTVWDVQGSAAAGMVTATVIVPASIATRLAGYATRGEVALVVTGATASSSFAPIRQHAKPKTRPSITIRPSTTPSTKPHVKASIKPKPTTKPSTKPTTKPSHHS
jgi:hypothetical protein